jgi:hypothetical protein
MQDLIVHILAKGQRYETANYPNVAIPTNLDVKDDVRKNFGRFTRRFSIARCRDNPKPSLPNIRGMRGSCDPCPGPTLDGNDLA